MCIVAPARGDRAGQVTFDIYAIHITHKQYNFCAARVSFHKFLSSFRLSDITTYVTVGTLPLMDGCDVWYTTLCYKIGMQTQHVGRRTWVGHLSLTQPRSPQLQSFF